jgi:hypothetical protein
MSRYPAYATIAMLAAAVTVSSGVQAQSTREAGNIVGGGFAAMAGGGGDTTVTYSTTGAGQGGSLRTQSGWNTQFLGNNGDGLQVGYLGARPSGAGRHAVMAGGGDNVQVVYISR